MSAEANKATVLRFFVDVNDQGQVDLLDTIATDDVIVHEPTAPGGLVQGRDALKGLVNMFQIGFPGHKTTVDQIMADGDMVTVIHTHYATNTGSFMGMPPTGRQVVVPGIEVFRLQHGQIAEFWRHDNDLGLMVQLGVVSLPGM